MKILVLEDEQTLLDVITKKLSLCDFEVLKASDVEGAIKLLSENTKVDCIWLDHYLFGDKDGLDFVAEIKNNPAWKDIPVFVVSNTASAEKVNSYLHLGVEKYYTKANYKLEDIINDITNSLHAKCKDINNQQKG